MPDGISFTEIIFNSSYRKIIDEKLANYKSYKEYEINFDMIEEIMTDYLLKNKKLLNDDIFEFILNQINMLWKTLLLINSLQEKFQLYKSMSFFMFKKLYFLRVNLSFISIKLIFNFKNYLFGSYLNLFSNIIKLIFKKSINLIFCIFIHNCNYCS